MDNLQSLVLDWLCNGEVGISSECMAMWLAFDKRTAGGGFGNHPHDPADFNRCRKLLHAVPGLRRRLDRMSQISKTWASLVRRWDEIEAMFNEEIQNGESGYAPRTYALMQEIIKAA